MQQGALLLRWCILQETANCIQFVPYVLSQHSTEHVWLLVWCTAEDKCSYYGINALFLLLQSAFCALVARSFVTCEYAA